MTEKDMKNWIDNATYDQLLHKWRFASSGDPFFQGEVGDYYVDRMKKMKLEIRPEQYIMTSKRVGWNK